MAKGFDLNNLLNGKSKAATGQETAAEGLAESKEFEIVMIDVEDLMPSKDNFYSTESINELAGSIELLGGIEQNLVVKPEAHGKYEVIAGHRRRLAVLKLASEGKPEYRKVPCRVKYESDSIKDELSLILTNSTARDMSDWEKIQQAKRLKELLEEYKQALTEENKDKPKEEKKRMGRIREIVAEMLNVSTTQVGRMEAIDNNLSSEFKEELQKGNINISTAHELSRQSEEKQKEAYGKYEEKGEIHIKDVKEEPEELTDEQIEEVQQAIIHAVTGTANRDIFKVKTTIEGIAKVLKKHFAGSFRGGKFETEDGKRLTYRWAAEGLTIINAEWKNFLVEYDDLAEIVAILIDEEELKYDDMPEETEKDITNKPEETEESRTAAGYESREITGQTYITDYKEVLPEVKEKGLDLTVWIGKRYGIGQYSLIKQVIRETMEQELKKGSSPAEWEDRLTNAVSVWMLGVSGEYKRYLDS